MIDSPPLHFLDLRCVQSSRGVRLRLGKVSKSPFNPLMGEDRPWESSGDSMYPNVVFDAVNRISKLWTTPFLERAKHEAQTLCYAASDDGLRWTKPDLGRFEFRGSTANNILLPFITGAGMALDERAKNPDERFKMTYLVHPELAPGWAAELRAHGYPLSKRGAGVGFSADGIHWKLHPDNPVLPGIAGHTHNNWVWCEQSRKYVLITRANVPFSDGRQRPGAERVVKRWESDNFIHWRDGRVVFRAEGDEIGRREYYSMPTFRHGNGWLGLLALFNSDPADDTVDCELAWSPDTIQWQRICRRELLIARDPPGSLDAGCIYAGWSPILLGDELPIYHAGSPGTHGSGIHRHSSLRLATLPRDRYAGLAADGEGENRDLRVGVRRVAVVPQRRCHPGQHCGGNPRMRQFTGAWFRTRTMQADARRLRAWHRRVERPAQPGCACRPQGSTALAAAAIHCLRSGISMIGHQQPRAKDQRQSRCGPCETRPRGSARHEQLDTRGVAGRGGTAEHRISWKTHRAGKGNCRLN